MLSASNFSIQFRPREKDVYTLSSKKSNFKNYLSHINPQKIFIAENVDLNFWINFVEIFLNSVVICNVAEKYVSYKM